MPALLAYSLSPVLIQAVTPGHLWGRMAASFKLVESVVIAIGAVVVGAISDQGSGLGNALSFTLVAILTLSALGLIGAYRPYSRSI